jgi:transposase
MAVTQTPICRKCESQGRRIRQLEAQVAALRTQVAELQDALAKATKNSRNSSKPPSSDIVHPPKKSARGRRRKRGPGGQPGHARRERRPIPKDQVHEFWEHYYDACPDCGGHLTWTDAQPKVMQHVELTRNPLWVEEHRSRCQRCDGCQKTHYCPFPPELIQAGLAGPRLTALVAFMKGFCHASYSTIRKFLRDVVGFRISRGQLAKLVQKVSAALQEPYEELLGFLPAEDVLNVDETGHKHQGDRFWTWCFRAACYTVYKIDPSRSSEVLIEVLGKEFNGILGCDYFGAYRKYMKEFNVPLQFCLAHLIRDVKYLTEHPDTRNRAYGERLLHDLRQIFGVIHRREKYKSDDTFQRALYDACSDLMWNATEELVDTRECANLAERFFSHAESFFRFLVTPGIEPTNNLAEQAIRFVAMHRRITQGTRGFKGQRWCERIFTVIATCQQQGRSVFDYLYRAVAAYFSGERAPSLLATPDTS